ncbi:MAG: hypothetical protein DRJ37_03130 [Thermoprotei archaeon]|nr:MAG: hypothetical protein DRJ37_03130 [Thermoprotei archaeon]
MKEELLINMPQTGILFLIGIEGLITGVIFNFSYSCRPWNVYSAAIHKPRCSRGSRSYARPPLWIFKEIRTQQEWPPRSIKEYRVESRNFLKKPYIYSFFRKNR